MQNLIARLRTTAESYLHDQSLRELQDRLSELFKPNTGWCYQKVQALPAVDEIDITQDKTVLVVAQPAPRRPPPGPPEALRQHRLQEPGLFSHRPAQCRRAPQRGQGVEGHPPHHR
ncbi:MAG: hypothetical protein MZV65_00780 [Chromatiales bacterium]|nr:hypothetical protein [Chromatiales bacterium]